jgi:hypothetical protein
VRLRQFSLLGPLITGIALGLGVIVFLHGITGGSDAASSQGAATSQTPEGAVAAFIQAQGAVYAGPCEQTRSPQDIGKVCSRLIDERGQMQAYLIGRTFSEFSTWVFVAPTSSGWTVIAISPLDFHDTSLTIPWPR